MPTSKCFIRYNDGGNPYKVCIDATNKNAPDKVWDKTKDRKPSYLTKTKKKFDDDKITASKYLQKLQDSNPKINTYDDMTPEQTRTYHRLYMRQKRREQSVLEQKALTDLKATQKELKEEKKKELAELKKGSVKKSLLKDVKRVSKQTEADELISQAIKKWNNGKGSFSDTDLAVLKKQLGKENYKKLLNRTINKIGDLQEKELTQTESQKEAFKKLMESKQGKGLEKNVLNEIKDMKAFEKNITEEIKDAEDEEEKAKKILLKQAVKRKERKRLNKKVRQALKAQQEGLKGKIGSQIVEELNKDLYGAYQGKRKKQLRTEKQVKDFLDTEIKDFSIPQIRGLAEGVLPKSTLIRDILKADNFVRKKVQKYIDLNKKSYINAFGEDEYKKE